jgi:phospholipid/cholesterol/gamma-HCH transport system substrate-binding protein
MNLLKAAEFKVGTMVLVIASLIAVMSMKVSSSPGLLGSSKDVWLQMDDAGGLVKGAQVRSAGIPVGVIKDIELTSEGKARVLLKLKPDNVLRTTAKAEIKSQGILGDKFISISQGSKDDPPLEEGGQILNVKDTGSLDSVMSQVRTVASSLKDTAQILKEAVSEDGTRKHILGRIVSNIEKITADIANITSDNKDKIGKIVDQVDRITYSLDDLLNSKDGKGLKAQLQQTMARLDSAVKNIDEITGKVNRGEGTIGRLINDEETVEGLNTAIDGVNGFLDTAGKTQTALDFNSSYLTGVAAAKTSVGVRIQPGLDRFYYLGIVDDPAGVVETVGTKTTTSTGTTETSEEKTYKNKVKFSLLYSKIFYDLTIKGGLIENAGGLGIDYNLYKDKLKFTLEAFEFSKLNLRAQLQYSFWKGLYVQGGVSDILNKQNRYNNYLGAGLLLTNDDLKLLMTKLPMM